MRIDQRRAGIVPWERYGDRRRNPRSRPQEPGGGFPGAPNGPLAAKEVFAGWARACNKVYVRPYRRKLVANRWALSRRIESRSSAVSM